jgi:hypothetical protein
MHRSWVSLEGHNPLEHCTLPRNWQGDTRWWGWKKLVKFKQSGYCFKCAFPNGNYAIPPHPEYNQKNVHCPWETKLYPILVWLMRDPAAWQNLCEQFHITPTMTEPEFAQWLMEEPPEHEFHRGLSILLWLFAQFPEFPPTPNPLPGTLD